MFLFLEYSEAVWYAGAPFPCIFRNVVFLKDNRLIIIMLQRRLWSMNAKISNGMLEFLKY